MLDEHPATRNDGEAKRRVVAAYQQRFGADRVREVEPASASEDFGLLGAAWGVPAVYWFVGGVDEQVFDAAMQAGKVDELPANHSPAFAPIIHPTLRSGVQAMLTAATVWLSPATPAPAQGA